MERAGETQLLDRPVQATRPSATLSTIRTILLHVQDDPSLDSRIENALVLARSCSAHLSCLHVVPIEAYVAFDQVGGLFVMNDVMKALDEQQAELRTKIEAKLGSEDVNWDYEEVTGSVAAQLIGHAALTDLVITSREPHRTEFVGSTVSFLGDLICNSRTPLFIPTDDGRPVDVTGSVLIAWDCSYEAANAVRSAVGLLKLASSVHILQIREDGKDEAFPSTRLLEYLSRHGVHAEYSVIEAGVDEHDQKVISDTLAARAQALRAAYLVMGGYNHSRVGEYIFGGVTRTMLAEAPLPLVIAR